MVAGWQRAGVGPLDPLPSGLFVLVRRQARSGGSLMGSPPGQFIYLFEGQGHHSAARRYRASDAIALPRMIDRGEDGGYFCQEQLLLRRRSGNCCPRRQPEFDGDWREVVIDGAGVGIDAPPPALIGGNWRGCSPHTAILLIGARKVEGTFPGR